MAQPFRLAVLKAVCDAIKGVSPAATRPDGLPYEHDLRDYVDAGSTTRPRVHRGRLLFGDTDPLPLVTVVEHPKPIEQDFPSGGHASTKGDWALLIQGFVDDDPEQPSDAAHVLAAEVASVLSAARGAKYDVLGLGGVLPCVSDIRVGSPVVRPPDGEISGSAYFYLTVVLTLVEDPANPFVP